ncbi:hypothetical protein HGRIS_011416 [Hohenbuehelia grisea]|uniref:FAD/NAD(P)-binding domain-containing protein n=1 Tax=Hohenbuehelia grisea TaxID=104357 RepID=A0ABR3JVU8_9AGAR
MAAVAQSVYDVLILGAGPGGLATAAGLARQLYTGIVFNSGVFRNARAAHMHTVLGFDHANPADFRAKAKDDILKRYDTITFQDNTTITALKKLENGNFEAADAQGKKWEGRKVVLAAGITDVLPDIEGFDQCWGYGVFHCLFCHGYEERGSESAGILAMGPLGNAAAPPMFARMANRFAKDIIIYTNGNADLANEISANLQGSVRGFKVDQKPIKRFEKLPAGAQVTVHFEDGSSTTHGFLTYKPAAKTNGPYAQLGVELGADGLIKVNQPFPETNVKGVFAVGDCTTQMTTVSVASMQGSIAAAGAIHQLQEEPS